jgi:hypothetical protein
MGRKADIRVEEMTAIRQTGERWNVDLVALLTKQLSNPLPNPSAAPSTMNQTKLDMHFLI